eukprot:1779298-Pyramimonas_sp.AAC.1
MVRPRLGELLVVRLDRVERLEVLGGAVVGDEGLAHGNALREVPHRGGPTHLTTALLPRNTRECEVGAASAPRLGHGGHEQLGLLELGVLLPCPVGPEGLLFLPQLLTFAPLPARIVVILQLLVACYRALPRPCSTVPSGAPAGEDVPVFLQLLPEGLLLRVLLRQGRGG